MKMKEAAITQIECGNLAFKAYVTEIKENGSISYYVDVR